MKESVKACLEQHLVDKLKKPNVVPASAWLASAEQHHKSAQMIINHDAAGALQSALRLEAETHGKIADFLACAFADDLQAKERGLIRTVQGGRNKSSYDDPRVGNAPLIGAAVNLAAKTTKIAIANLKPRPEAN